MRQGARVLAFDASQTTFRHRIYKGADAKLLENVAHFNNGSM